MDINENIIEALEIKCEILEKQKVILTDQVRISEEIAGNNQKKEDILFQSLSNARQVKYQLLAVIATEAALIFFLLFFQLT